MIDQLNTLISRGENFDFTMQYDYPAVKKWIEETGFMLAGFDHEAQQFRLYCVESYWFPSEKVNHCLHILRELRHRLRNDRNRQQPPVR